MKRDMDLVRGILLLAEGAEGPVDKGAITSAFGCTDEQAVFHVELMASHGLVDARVRRVTSGAAAAVVSVSGLTWDGFDYLDAIRSADVWTRAKGAIAEAVGDAPLAVIKSVCTALAERLVMERLGL